MSLQQNVASLNGAQHVNEPGAAFDYANVNHILLGAIIERVSGQSYAGFMDENVFKPLKMDSTSATLAPTIKGYQSWFGINVPSFVSYNSADAAAGYLTSNASDLALFLEEQTNPNNPVSRLMVSDEFVDNAIIPEPNRKQSNGWFVYSQNNDNYIAKQGAVYDFGAAEVYNTTTKNGAIVLANLQYAGATDKDQLAQGIVSILDGKDPQSVSVPAQMWNGLIGLVLIGILGGLIYRHRNHTYRHRKLALTVGIACLLAIPLLIGVYAISTGSRFVSNSLVLVYGVPDLCAILFAVFILLTVLSGMIIRNARRNTKTKQ